MKGTPITYFKGVVREGKKIRWPKKEVFLPSIAVVICIAIFAGIFIVLEDLAGGSLIEQLRNAFSSLR